jgi:putative endonuclease
VLYTGVTNDLDRRLAEHKDGESIESAFTKKYGVKYLLRYERFQRIMDAIAREKEIKGWRREKKIKLIESENPYWKFLNQEDI